MADDIMTFDEILEDPTYKSEFDRRVTKALSTVQAKLDAEIKKSSGMKSSEDFSALEEELNKSKTELGKLKQEKYVLSKGLTGEEAEFIAFKAGKMVDAKTTFEQAVDALTDDRKKTSFDWTAPVGGGKQKTGETDVMNALIRGALK